MHDPKHEVTIGLVGKYIDLPDAYLSVTEALKAGGFAHQTKVEHPLGSVRRVRDARGRGEACWAISTASSFPAASACAASRASSARCSFARENGIPTLGLCLGLQCMVIEYARNVAGLAGASSSEFDPDTEFPVIATMAEQVDIIDQRRPGRHDAPRPVRGGARRRARSSQELYGATDDRRASPSPLRGEQRVPRADRARPA